MTRFEIAPKIVEDFDFGYLPWQRYLFFPVGINSKSFLYCQEDKKYAKLELHLRGSHWFSSNYLTVKQYQERSNGFN